MTLLTQYRSHISWERYAKDYLVKRQSCSFFSLCKNKPIIGAIITIFMMFSSRLWMMRGQWQRRQSDIDSPRQLRPAYQQ